MIPVRPRSGDMRAKNASVPVYSVVNAKDPDMVHITLTLTNGYKLVCGESNRISGSTLKAMD